MLNHYQPQEIVMLRSSNFLAIALSATAIVSVTIPTTAFASQVCGGSSSIVAEIHPAQASNVVQTSQNASRPKIGVDLPTKVPTGPVYSGLGSGGKLIPAKPTGPVYSGLGPDGKLIQAPKYPAGDATKVVKGPQIPDGDLFCGKHPTADFCHSGSSPSSGSGRGSGNGSGGGRGRHRGGGKRSRGGRRERSRVG